jgi:hypothetical protein
MNLWRYVASIGFKPLVAGNIKGFHNVYGNPTTQAGFAEATKQNPYMVSGGGRVRGEQEGGREGGREAKLSYLCRVASLPRVLHSMWCRFAALMHSARPTGAPSDGFPAAQRQIIIAHLPTPPPLQVASFCDGSKVSFEQVVVANATGARVPQRGMYGKTLRAPVEEAPSLYDLQALVKGGPIVDYVVGLKPAAGVFVLGYDDAPLTQHYMAYYKQVSQLDSGCRRQQIGLFFSRLCLYE